MSSTQLTNQITADVRALRSGDLAEGAMKLFRTLGYESTRVVPDVDDDRPAAFLERLQANVTDTLSEQEFRKVVSSVKLLFQVTDSEIQSAGSQTADMFSSMADASDTNITQSFFFAVAELKDETYPRGVYARVAREINKRLPLATVVLMRNDSNNVSLAFVDRREHRRQPGRAVLGNVALMREIDTKVPHRAHLDILSELALDDRLGWMANTGTPNDFAGLLASWLDVLNTEELNKRFYQGLFKWYQRAMEVAKFPTSDEPVEEQVIRLITRLMFVWFIKEKQFVSKELFNEQQASEMLKDYDAADGDSYYRCILQNLFFATLNTPVLDRKFATDAGVKADDNNASGFRYKYVDEIEQVEELRESFHNSPFVNGGLFDCLDERDEAGGRLIEVVDCFSDKPEHINKISIPNRLFFDDDGIVTHFNRFKFTVEESTPLEQEVALDPELLGNVFESLLAAYVPETKQTKQAKTGSYYTPRKVVDYMVDEALKESLLARVSDELTHSTDLEERILDLFDYGVTEQDFSDAEAQTLVRAIAETKILDPAVGSGAFPMAALHKLTLALRKLDPTNDLWRDHQRDLAMERTEEAYDADTQADRDEMLQEISDVFETYRDSDYGRKLFLIQNCIFGVDIQPIAVQISKLRFFISLAIEQQRMDKGDENYGIRALPNLETRFVIADTLLPLAQPEQTTLGDSEIIGAKLQNLMANRERHFRAYEPAEKDALRRTDDALRRELGALLRQRGMPVTDADRLASWDPFNHSSVAQWFNAKFMFNIQDGFDVVIGNPPYAQLQKQRSLLAERYSTAGFTTLRKRGDIYQLFQEAALSLAKPETGLIVLITSNSWMRAKSGDGTREILKSDAQVLKLIELGKGVFSNAVVDTNVLIARTGSSPRLRLAVDVEQSRDGSFPPSPCDWVSLSETDGDSWSPMSTDQEEILRTMIQRGVQLSDWNVKIRMGIKTSCNEAFLIDNSTRTALISNDASSSDLISPVLRGRDIRKWHSESELYLITSHGGYGPYEHVNVESYPAVKEHLDQFMDSLVERRGTFVTPYNHARSTSWAQFNEPKLIWKELSNGGCFTYEIDQVYCVNTAYVMTGDSIKYVCGVLNSSVVAWYHRHISLNTGMGLTRWVRFVVDRLPVPKSTSDDQLAVEALVDRLTAATAEGSDTSELERELDGMVYDLYGLTESQVEDVEAAMRR